MIKKYIQNSIKELNNVTWPTKNQAIRITTIVFIFMLISAVILGFIDEILAYGFRLLLNL